MRSDDVQARIANLSNYELVVNHFDLGSENPHIEFDRRSYPGVEAHLFTTADAASWQPALTQSADVILHRPTNIHGPEHDRLVTWMGLLGTIEYVMRELEPYRRGLSHGIIPSSQWAYHENTWYRKNWEGPPREITPVESFLHLVDDSIKFHIKELNKLGFQTTQSCSGLAKDHQEREAYLPYVMFDERIYPRSSAHLFTIADISGWIPSYGPHNFDVEVRLPSADGAEQFWDKLVDSARDMTTLLREYRMGHAQVP